MLVEYLLVVFIITFIVDTQVLLDENSVISIVRISFYLNNLAAK